MPAESSQPNLQETVEKIRSAVLRTQVSGRNADVSVLRSPRNPPIKEQGAHYEDLALKADQQEIDHAHDDHTTRLSYAKTVGIGVAVWMTFVGTVLVLVGCGVLGLSDSVIKWILTTTTAKVLGTFWIVLNYFYGDNNIKQPKD